MSCGTIDNGKNDFYAINNYQLCGDASFHESGYDQLIEQFKDFTIPLFFSEVGCNNLKRYFKEPEYIFGSEMVSQFNRSSWTHSNI